MEASAVTTNIFSDSYSTDHSKRGVALIFNHKEYDEKQMKPRDGTEKDARTLESVLKSLGFDVKVFNDLGYGELYDVLQEVADADRSEYSCMVIAVMSHGESGYIHARDHKYKPETLWNPFTGDKCATLAGKPKVFFIQACRGEAVDDGVKVLNRSSQISRDSMGSPSSYTIPAMADILVMYSTYDGYYSWRNPTSGSWFIQSLSQELNENAAKHDLVTILTFVNRRMAIGFESNVPGNKNMHRKKQIGSIVSTLTRKLYFYQSSNN